jgi:uncharacterized protein
MWKPTILFLVLTAVLSSIFYVIINITGTLTLWVFGLMWMPALAAVLTCVIIRRPLRFLGGSRWSTKYGVIAYLVPILYCLAMFGFAWIFGFGSVPNVDNVHTTTTALGVDGLPDSAQVVLFIVVLALVGLVSEIGPALGEEIGWRGFLVPELYRNMGFIGTSIVSGLVLAFWHFPVLGVAYQSLDVPAWFWVPTFGVGAIGISFIAAWLRLKSGSLWPAVILHASANLFQQAIFFALTIPNELTNYVAGDVGVGISVVLVIAAIITIVLRKQLPSREDFDLINGVPHNLDPIPITLAEPAVR